MPSRDFLNNGTENKQIMISWLAGRLFDQNAIVNKRYFFKFNVESKYSCTNILTIDILQ